MLIHNIAEYHKATSSNTSKCIGLVPTMGALHEGHLSLLQTALKECDIVVVSIFVNPTQFNDTNDLAHYPRTLDKDLEAIYNISKGVLVYLPKVNEIYPNGIFAEEFSFGSISQHMEGKYRKGHFNGVGTVLKSLFDLLKPNTAYFGEKDYQQLTIVKKLVELTRQKVQIVGCKTLRDSDGLAKSSRNTLLSKMEREKASLLYKQLVFAKENFETISISKIKKKVKIAFKSSDIFILEYFEIVSIEDLIPIQTKKENTKYRAFIAAFCGNVRLIDNIALN